MNEKTSNKRSFVSKSDHLSSSDSLNLSVTDISRFLLDEDSVNNFLVSSLSLLDASATQRSTGYLLLYYLPGFHLTKSYLEQLYSKVLKLSEESTKNAGIFKEVLKMLLWLLPRLATGAITASLDSQSLLLPFTQACRKKNSSYRSFIPIARISTINVMAIAHTRNKLVTIRRNEKCLFLRSNDVPNSSNWPIKDYIYQAPLQTTAQELEHYLRAMIQFSYQYHTNSTVIQATSFFIRQICDAYVNKVAQGPPYTNFRTVTSYFLPTILEWMKADYQCVRNHVYDFILNLSAHVELVDSQNIYAGASLEVQGEVIWILLLVLRHQVLITPYEQETWVAAAKCILAVLPRAERSRVDCRVYVQILKNPSLAELNPDAFGRFVEAFVLSLLQPKKKNAKKRGVNPIFTVPHEINKREFEKLGKNPMADILMLYRRAYSIGGRLWLFKLIFALGVERLRGTEKIEDIDEFETSVCESFECFVAYGFFWYWHSHLFFTSPFIRAETIEKFSVTPGLYTDQTRVIHLKILDYFFELEDGETLLPEYLRSFLTSHYASDDLASAKSEEVFDDVLHSAQVSLSNTSNHGDFDSNHYNIGLRLLVYCLHIMRSKRDGGDRLLQRFIDVFFSEEAKNQPSDKRIRQVIPDLLTCEFIRWKTTCGDRALYRVDYSSESEKDIFEVIMEAYLATKPKTQQLMGLYYCLLENVVEYQGALYNSDISESADLSLLLLDVGAILKEDAVSLIGNSFFLLSYHCLSTETSLCACRARQVIASILTHLCQNELFGGNLWRKILADSYPPVAYISATHIVNKYRKCKMDVAEKGPPFHLMWRFLCASAQPLISDNDAKTAAADNAPEPQKKGENK